MNRFDVLERSSDVRRHLLLEASAGTGKTFSIENIVVRLLIEGDLPQTLENILIVTFTKAATRDLKFRIRSNIAKAYEILQKPEKASIDYLEAIREKGGDSVKTACSRLEQALFYYDQAQIFTIHGFCFRMLRENLFEGGFSPEAVSSEETVGNSEILKIIRDYFRTELTSECCSSTQLRILLKKHPELDKALLKLINEGCSIEPIPIFSDFLLQFRKIMKNLKNYFKATPEKIIEDFEMQQGAYKVLKDEDPGSVNEFAFLFGKEDWTEKDFNLVLENCLYIARKLDPLNQKKTTKAPKSELLHYPDFIKHLRTNLLPLVCSASNVEGIFSRIGFECQLFVKKYLERQEKMGFSEILECMLKAVRENANFVTKILNRYQVGIIDEFQDTDPVQWEIFQKLFHKEGKYLYLVGDPKQSIYAFRRADIYTYWDAANLVGLDNRAHLDTNYRSTPSLITALNKFFQGPKSFIELPRRNISLPYHPVRAPLKGNFPFEDGKGSLHFFIKDLAEKEKINDLEAFFPFMVNEILSLNRYSKIKFNHIAILVKDQYQGAHFAQFCKEYGLPTAVQKRIDLSECACVGYLREFMTAVINPRDLSKVKLALAGSIIGWNHQDLRGWVELASMEKMLANFYSLRRILIQDGFAQFYQSLMQSCWQQDPPHCVMESILEKINGDDFFDELNQIAELLIEHQGKTHCAPEGLIKFLEELTHLEIFEEDSVKRRNDPNRDAIQIITMHSSKGLEFDIVFALGIIKRTPEISRLIPIPRNKSYLIKAVDEESKEYLDHCNEIDAEKMRQLYVTLTRAKHRLYVPLILGQKESSRPGTFSPMELFLNRLFPEPGLSHVIPFIEQNKPEMSFTILQDGLVKEELKNQCFQLNLICHSPPLIPGRIQLMHSYTTLAKRVAISVPHGTEKLKAPKNFGEVSKTPHTLPSSAETGILIHKILETIPLDCCKSIKTFYELLPTISPFLKGTDYLGWESVFCEIIFNTLKIDLGGFCLSDVNPHHTYREIEFMYPTANGFLKGVIDLVFEHGGRYFIVDWKSNWLGPSGKDYTTEKIGESMKENDYYLQSDLYKEAWIRYLQLIKKVCNSEKDIGILYLFVRGIEPYIPNQGLVFV